MSRVPLYARSQLNVQSPTVCPIPARSPGTPTGQCPTPTPDQGPPRARALRGGDIETRLKKAQALRDEADKRLADLRANITMMLPHELKTPLNGILAYGELLMGCQESPLPPEEIAEMGQTICESGRRLERLIENFLIYSQVEMMESDPARTAALRKKQTPLPGKIIEKSATGQAEAAGRPGDLVLELADKATAISDEYLGRIVDELVLNAFKFSRAGTPVKVSLSAVANELILTVADKGEGMSADQIRNVGLYGQFDRKKREQQGLGFGLIIAKKLTELHGGNFAIESELGAGAKVIVKLPLAGLN